MTRIAVALCRFGADEGGAVTIDWVALTSGVLLLGITTTYAIFNNGATSLVGEINLTLTVLGSDIAADYEANSATDDGTGGGGPVASGSASQRACDRTLKYVVCVGKK